MYINTFTVAPLFQCISKESISMFFRLTDLGKPVTVIGQDLDRSALTIEAINSLRRFLCPNAEQELHRVMFEDAGQIGFLI